MAASPMMMATVMTDFITAPTVVCSYHAMMGDDADVAGAFSSSPLLPLPLAVRLLCCPLGVERQFLLTRSRMYQSGPVHV